MENRGRKNGGRADVFSLDFPIQECVSSFVAVLVIVSLAWADYRDKVRDAFLCNERVMDASAMFDL